MYVLGIGDQTHDPSICIAKDGVIISAIELERLTRIKHNLVVDTHYYKIDKMGEFFETLCQQFPIKTREKLYLKGIEYCLQAAEITDIKKIKFAVLSSLFPQPAFPYKSIIINHHLAHAASAFYASPFQNAAILTLDGYGNNLDGIMHETGTCGIGYQNHIEIIRNFQGKFQISETERKHGIKNTIIMLENSIGAFYKNITVLLNLGHFGEGKTMGLAAYGEYNPTFNKIRGYIQLSKDGEYYINNREIYGICQQLLNEAENTLKPERLFKFRADLAYSAQHLCEEIVIHCCNSLYKETKKKSLCFAGGVALNSHINGKITSKTPFENIFIQPAAGDSGISIGCAYYGSYMLGNIARSSQKNISFSPYLGKHYSQDEIKNTVYNYKETLKEIKISSDLFSYIANMIANDKIIGWFNGKSEVGPRALGNRSILANPQNALLKDYLNIQIKCRETFRPFAPVILEEYTKDFFESTTALPYMLQIVNVKSDVKKNIPAVVHYDNTARIQTVNQSQNRDLYKLIKAFKNITGIPILLNTSFNGNGEPIVETPDDCIRSFIKLKLDALFMNGRFYINKNQ